VTLPPAPIDAAGREPTRRGFDRVGRTRFTGLGAVLIAVVVFTVTTPPQALDRQLVAVVWAAMIAVLVVGIVWPLVAVRRVALTASSVTDATVGDLVPVEIDLRGRVGPCEVRALDPTGAWHRVAGAGAGTLHHLAERRGVFDGLRVEVRVTAPLGVLAAHQVHWVELPRPIAVAPRPLAVDWRQVTAPSEGGGRPQGVGRPGGDLVRSVRPYAAGDPAHLVHWPSTARTGTLVVKELEPPAPTGQVIVVDLRALGDDVERAASYAYGAARAVLAQGGVLVLCTAEVDGACTAAVGSLLQAGRRLARAVDGVPGTPPPGWPIVEIGR
jgi:uncharacterized protein (DUF58 family)